MLVEVRHEGGETRLHAFDRDGMAGTLCGAVQGFDFADYRDVTPSA